MTSADAINEIQRATDFKAPLDPGTRASDQTCASIQLDSITTPADFDFTVESYTCRTNSEGLIDATSPLTDESCFGDGKIATEGASGDTATRLRAVV